MPVSINSLRPSRGGSTAPYLASHSLRSLSPSLVTNTVILDTEYLAALNALSPLQQERSALQKTVGNLKKNKLPCDPAHLATLSTLSAKIKKAQTAIDAMFATLEAAIGEIANVVDTDFCLPAFPKSLPSSTATFQPTFLSPNSPTSPLTLYTTAFFSSFAKDADLSSFKNSFMPLKHLPSRHATQTPTTLTLLSLTPTRLSSSRAELTYFTTLLLTFLTSLNLSPTLTLLPPAALPLSSATTVHLHLTKPLCTLTNATSYHTSLHEIRAGVKQMIQINKDYCHEVTATLDLAVLESHLPPDFAVNLPPVVYLTLLNQHLSLHPYIGGFVFGDDDRETLRRIAPVLNGGVLERNEHVKRWANHVVKIT